MKLRQLTLRKLEIPFKVAFRHASATRSETESVLVVAESETGKKGFGEGCPRHYVTDENLDTVFGFFETHQPEWSTLTGLDDLKAWAAKHRKEVDLNPAAWCAVELALLDLMARENNQPVEELLSLPKLDGDFQYTAVLGVGSPASFQKQRDQYLQWGFTDFKLKVSGNAQEDRDRLKSFSELRDLSVRVRLDANNLWKDADEATAYLDQLDYPVFALEEPLRAGDYEGCRKLFEAFNTPIILDESFLRVDQFQRIEKDPETWIINLRVSKMGGLVRSLAIVDQTKRLNLPVIVGAQVGETSILTRAALTTAHAVRDFLIAQEGAFGTHLLERDVIDPPLMFGKGGRLSSTPFAHKPGLGPEVDFRGFD